VALLAVIVGIVRTLFAVPEAGRTYKGSVEGRLYVVGEQVPWESTGCRRLDAVRNRIPSSKRAGRRNEGTPTHP
jgi:hypothetical protein